MLTQEELNALSNDELANLAGTVVGKLLALDIEEVMEEFFETLGARDVNILHDSARGWLDADEEADEEEDDDEVEDAEEVDDE